MATNNNPRYKNGALRRKHRRRLMAMGLPCHICGQPIHYDEPSDSNHPYSFVVDEIIPISKYWMAGYQSKEAAAQDFSNLAPAHYICNQIKGNKTNFVLHELPAKKQKPRKPIELDGEW